MTKRTNVMLWVVQGLLAALFLFAGVMKLVLPIEAMTLPVALPGGFLRFIGVVEVAGALGLILPGALRIRTGLTPLAAAGLVICHDWRDRGHPYRRRGGAGALSSLRGAGVRWGGPPPVAERRRASRCGQPQGSRVPRPSRGCPAMTARPTSTGRATLPTSVSADQTESTGPWPASARVPESARRSRPPWKSALPLRACAPRLPATRIRWPRCRTLFRAA